ncbi:MAG: M1 family metallopeptidase [Bacteroidetes bacterium]|nr:M1 family metallopeptidase [Bacteroidota bacterium]HET6244913.1 M1 family metallopeptidase [Bacteroidia bacterium]
MNIKIKLFLFTLTVIFSANVVAQEKMRSYSVDKELTPREHNIDMKHMRLEVEFEPQIGLVKGKVTHFFQPIQSQVDSIFLDAPGITIKEANLNGKAVTFKMNPQGITIYPKQPLKWGTNDSLTLVYEAYPRKGIYFIGWNDPNNLSRKQIWTQGQGIDNRHWIPCYDESNDKLTTEIIVNFNARYKVLSNGIKLGEKDNGNGNKTWHYKMSNPHATYLIMLGIGEYAIKQKQSESGVPMNFWYYPEWEDRFEHAYKYSEQMMDFFEKEIGIPYPWESYSQIPVQDFMYGAMENTTATLFGDFSFVDSRSYLDKNYVGTNAHELAHQWFGDMITARTSSHLWLQESFATHYNMMFERVVFGQDHFDWKRRNSENSALAASKKDKLPIAHSEAGTSRWYPKGAVVLEMLKYVTSRESFNKSIKHYLEKHAYKNVDSNDLLIAFHETLGLSLDWFWDQWIYKGGEPNYSVSFREIKLAAGEAFSEFDITQIHETNDKTGLFKMPFVFEVHYLDGSKDSQRIWIEKQQHTIRIGNPKNKKVAFALFDPNNQVIKQVSFQKTTEMLKIQALKAPFMLDRYDAVVALRKISVDQKIDLYNQIFKTEKFHAVKSEIISQIINADDKTSTGLIIAALKDRDAEVRQSVIQNTTKLPLVLLKDYEQLLMDSSYDIQALALEKLCEQFVDKKAGYLKLTEGSFGTRGLNVKVKWLEISAPLNKKHLDELVSLTSNSYEFITRSNAMAALKRLNHFDSVLMENLFEASFSPNRKLSGAALECLKHFCNQSVCKNMVAVYIEQNKWEDHRKDIANGILN